MYRLGDDRAAVREIQRYLHFISDRRYAEIPRVAIDGYYGEETKIAVKEFQKLMGIIESGTVDYQTFTKLYDEYLKAKLLSKAEESFIDEKRFPFALGDKGREVLYINLMLDELSKYFCELGRVDIKPYFSLSTENAIKEIRSIFMLNPIPNVDFNLFERMKYELKLRGGENNIR